MTIELQFPVIRTGTRKKVDGKELTLYSLQIRPINARRSLAVLA